MEVVWGFICWLSKLYLVGCLMASVCFIPWHLLYVREAKDHNAMVVSFLVLVFGLHWFFVASCLFGMGEFIFHKFEEVRQDMICRKKVSKKSERDRVIRQKEILKERILELEKALAIKEFLLNKATEWLGKKESNNLSSIIRRDSIVAYLKSRNDTLTEEDVADIFRRIG